MLAEKKYIPLYLWKGLQINRPNQVWEIDITYIPMEEGFMYLTCIIDVYSCAIMGWVLSNTLDAVASLEVVKQAIRDNSKPEVLNAD